MTTSKTSPQNDALTPDSAFVVQFRTNSDPASGFAAGHVEHVTSGAATRFESVTELWAFITRVLVEQLHSRIEREMT